MPSTSIYLDEEIIEKIDSHLEEGDSRSQWIQEAIRRQLNHDHDDLEELEQRMDEFEQWKEKTMEEVVEWFTSEFGPSS